MTRPAPELTWQISRVYYPMRSTAFWVNRGRVTRWQFLRAAVWPWTGQTWFMLRAWLV